LSVGALGGDKVLVGRIGGCRLELGPAARIKIGQPAEEEQEGPAISDDVMQVDVPDEPRRAQPNQRRVEKAAVELKALPGARLQPLLEGHIGVGLVREVYQFQIARRRRKQALAGNSCDFLDDSAQRIGSLRQDAKGGAEAQRVQRTGDDVGSGKVIEWRLRLQLLPQPDQLLVARQVTLLLQVAQQRCGGGS
jgi:hypothetical protein